MIIVRNILFLIGVVILSACATGGSSNKAENELVQEKVLNQDITTPPSLFDAETVSASDADSGSGNTDQQEQ